MGSLISDGEYTALSPLQDTNLGTQLRPIPLSFTPCPMGLLRERILNYDLHIYLEWQPLLPSCPSQSIPLSIISLASPISPFSLITSSLIFSWYLSLSLSLSLSLILQIWYNSSSSCFGFECVFVNFPLTLQFDAFFLLGSSIFESWAVFDRGACLNLGVGVCWLFNTIGQRYL